MMLGGYYYSLEPGFFCCPGPLPAVKVSRIEHIFRFSTVSPFPSAESVGTEMDEHVALHHLPPYLGRGRDGAIRFRSPSARADEGRRKGE